MSVTDESSTFPLAAASMPEVTDEDGRLVRVVAPSRLHFGLLSFGHRAGRRYGGIGLMIDRPAVRLSLSGAGPAYHRFRDAT